MAISAAKLAELRAKAMAKTTTLGALPAQEYKAVEAEATLSVASIATPTPTATPVSNVVSGNPGDGESVDLTPQQFSVVEKIERIKQLLLTQDPLIEVLLKQVHTALHKDPELMHFLKPEQIGAVTQGCLQIAKIVVIASAVKKTTTASGKKLSQLTLADI